MYRVIVSALAIVAVVGCADTRKLMGEDVKRTNLFPCPATKTPIGDVPSCGKAWKLTSGSAELTPSGDLSAEVKGLVLNDASTGATGRPMVWMESQRQSCAAA